MYKMRKYIEVFLILSAICQCFGQHVEEIIRNDFDGPHEDGSYKWAFQTEGGIYHEQRGTLQKTAAAEQSLLVQGQYQYTAPDGQVINVLYTADEKGFRAEGAHIPTPPPIPPAIQRALDYLATLPTTESPLYTGH